MNTTITITFKDGLVCKFKNVIEFTHLKNSVRIMGEVLFDLSKYNGKSTWRMIARTYDKSEIKNINIEYN